MKIIVITIGLMTIFSGCTAAKVKQITTLGSAATIKCYSGGQLIYDGKSTGKVAAEDQSDGWFFVDAVTEKLIRVSGDCIIEN